MDHRSLYKSNKLNETKSARVIESRRLRADKRRDIHANARNLSPENEEIAISNKKGSKKKNDLYSKYSAYKKEKAKRLEEERKSRKIPFITVVRSGNSSKNSFYSSFAPADYFFNGPTGVSIIEKKSVRSEKVKATPNKVVLKERNDNNARREPLESGNTKKPMKTAIIKAQQENNHTSKDQNKKSKKNIKKTALKKENSITPGKPKSISSNTSKLEDATSKSYSAFENFVTSTQRKSVSKNSNVCVYDSTFADNLSPIGTKTVNVLSNETLISSTGKDKNPAMFAVKTEINSETPIKRSNYVLAPENEVNPSVNDETFNATDNMDLDKTPINNVEPNNYVSPFVTTSRGKYSLKREREKRDSIYKLDKCYTPEETIVDRRKRESIKYFRKVLDDEIRRLYAMCDDWEKYKVDSIHIIDQNTVDMIFVSVAQTKLLITKKFEQFRGLIKECEMANSIGPAVHPEDLEGFWSMIRVQVEDIDKRFANLNRWKANEWFDPDEVNPKKEKISKPMKSKVKKKNIKASSVVLDLIKQAKSECIRSRQEGIHLDTDAILLKSDNKTETSPVPRLLRARPSLPAATPTPKSQSSRRVTGIHQLKLQNSVLKSKIQRNSPFVASPLRKSILKTPGTQRKNKSVIFNEQLLFKSPDISFGRKSDLDLSDSDSRRSLRLRSRKVLMRNEE